MFKCLPDYVFRGLKAQTRTGTKCSVRNVYGHNVSFLGCHHQKYFCSGQNAKEIEITNLLKQNLESAQVKVTDISGGCGSMYNIEVTSPSFIGKNRVMQQRMVNDILKEQIADMHGLTLTTKKP
mmetsp:Transcript_16002/g.19859  ORF Transcript_16002/g.19859 Transcript_16002/m.19859 type:complete len:124 (+) Transcript_16002:181-552(+)